MPIECFMNKLILCLIEWLLFLQNILQKHSALFLVPLAARLVNDESPGCRKMAAQCIKKLLTKVNHLRKKNASIKKHMYIRNRF